MDEVATDFSSASSGGAVNADAAAAVVGIGFQIVVPDDVVFYDGVDVRAVLGVTVTVVFNHIATHQQHRIAGSHVHDADAARHVLCYTFNIVTHNDDRVFSTGSYIDLRYIGITQVVVLEIVTDDFRGSGRVYRRSDGRLLVVVEIAILDGRAAVHVVDGGVAETAEYTIIKKYRPSVKKKYLLPILKMNIRQICMGGLIQQELEK